MAVTEKQIVIVGCGPGGPDYVTPAAHEAVARTDVVLGPKRLLALFPDCAERQNLLPPAVEPAIEVVTEHLPHGTVAVLVSGDPGMFSLATPLVAHFGQATCHVIPGISSLTVAFARLGISLSDARIVSAHGRIPDLSADELSRSEKIAIFGGTKDATAWVARVAQTLSPTHTLFVCENLTLADESVRELTAESLLAAELPSLTLMILVERHLLGQTDDRPDPRRG